MSGPFRFQDRWQSSLGPLWRAAETDPGAMEQLLRLLEDRDRNLETYVETGDGTYVPTLTGMAVGTGGSNSAGYVASREGSFWKVHVEGAVVFGTSGDTFPTGVAGTPTISIPPGFTLTSSLARPLGRVNMRDSSTGFGYDGPMLRSSSTALRPFATGTAGLITAVTGSVPFTWDTEDSFVWSADFTAVRTAR